MTIHDDGKGLGENRPNHKNTTMGLTSIHRRVQYLNGEIHIQSSNKGTEIIVSIPLGAA
ncbi:hypothetical protein [Pedobacter sp. UC225_65]|uniref:hypothetical protein n=1 Tax=Pedobacter sp. UC225_65 TaxID=3350173 RepID=UPI00366F3EEF